MAAEEAGPGWIAKVPNALSVLRLALAGAFPLATAEWRLSVVVAAGMTDWLDGRIARRFRVQSVAGGLLDAFADKVFAVSVLLTLVLRGDIAWWQVLLVVARDIVVLTVAAYYGARRHWAAFRGMPSRMTGKVTTVLLFIWFLVLVAPWAEPARMPVFVLTAGSSVMAAGDYVLRFVNALRHPPSLTEADTAR